MEESAMTAKPKATGWLAENGPKELELRFRAFVFNPSAPILLIDDDRRCLEAAHARARFVFFIRLFATEVKGKMRNRKRVANS
jgi:hypothetical protein